MTDDRRYRWVVLAAAVAITAVSLGSLFSLAVFLKPLEDGMRWSRATVGAISLLNWIVMGIGSFVAGSLSDRFGTRAVILAGGALLGTGLVASSQVASPWHFYASFGVLVAAGVSCSLVPLTVTAVKWFPGRRGLAAALVSSGIGLGVLALSPLSRWLIDWLEWRLAFVVLGDLAWLTIVPLALLVRDPGDRRAPPGVAPARSIAGGVSDRAARGPSPARTWPFWAIALTHFACCAAHSGPIFHMVTHALDLGIPRMTAAAMLGASGLSSIFSRVATGLIADRVGAKPTLIGALLVQAGTIAAYLVARDLNSLYLLGLAFGVAYGGAMPLYPVVTREYFGERVMGAAYGAVFFISCIGMGLGSWAGGIIHDTLGSYWWLFLGSASVGAGAVALAIFLRPPLASRAVIA